MTDRRKEFGRRGVNPPPVVTHAPQGLPGGAEPPSSRQMRTLAIALGALGATAFSLFALVQALQPHHSSLDCPPRDGSAPDAANCQESTGHSGGGSGSSGSGSQSSSGASSSSASHSAAFGGFGGTGAGHGGGAGE